MTVALASTMTVAKLKRALRSAKNSLPVIVETDGDQEGTLSVATTTFNSAPALAIQIPAAVEEPPPIP